MSGAHWTIELIWLVSIRPFRSFRQYADAPVAAPAHRAQVLRGSARHRHHAGENERRPAAKRLRRLGNRRRDERTAAADAHEGAVGRRDLGARARPAQAARRAAQRGDETGAAEEDQTIAGAAPGVDERGGRFVGGRRCGGSDTGGEPGAGGGHRNGCERCAAVGDIGDVERRRRRHVFAYVVGIECGL